MIRPLRDKIIVRRFEKELDIGGIVLLESSVEPAVYGEVVAVGPGKRDKSGRVVPIGLSVGDKIAFCTYGGVPFTVDGEELLIMGADSLIGFAH